MGNLEHPGIKLVFYVSCVNMCLSRDHRRILVPKNKVNGMTQKVFLLHNFVSFHKQGRLDEHMKLHENETESERLARQRKKKVDSLSDDVIEQMKDRYERVIDPKNGEIRMKCKHCTSREFRMISSLERHEQDHKAGKVTVKSPGSYPCEICKKSFNSKGRLKEHTDLNHQESKDGNKEIIARKVHPQCKKCNKSFKWKSCLQAHMKKCTVVPSKKGANKRKATLKAIGKIQEQIVEFSSDGGISSDPDSLSLPLTEVRKKRKHVDFQLASETQISTKVLKVDDNTRKTVRTKSKLDVSGNVDRTPLQESMDVDNTERNGNKSFAESLDNKIPNSSKEKPGEKQLLQDQSLTEFPKASHKNNSIDPINADAIISNAANDAQEAEHYFIVQQTEEEPGTSSSGGSTQQVLQSPTLITIPIVDQSGIKEPVLMQVQIQPDASQNSTIATDALVETLMNLGGSIADQ